MAKASLWNIPDAETRKLGEQTGLDTLVVPALNDVHLVLPKLGSAVANALNVPPGDYGRKVETQRN